MNGNLVQKVLEHSSVTRTFVSLVYPISSDVSSFNCSWSRGGEGRESLSWIRMTRTARQDARRPGKEDAGHSLLF